MAASDLLLLLSCLRWRGMVLMSKKQADIGLQSSKGWIVDGSQQGQSLSPDELALCALLARIMQRCIAERDERIMVLLGSSTSVQSTESEAMRESVA